MTAYSTFTTYSERPAPVGYLPFLILRSLIITRVGEDRGRPTPDIRAR
jgi:hypothetical protein